jgi:hypothetical protein
MDKARSPLIPVSWGELLDKITILEIKKERIGDRAALRNVVRELERLTEAADGVDGRPGVAALIAELRLVNTRLWDIEEQIREKEAVADFGAEFVRIARSVYKNNDVRAALKRELNLLLNSALVEEKSYGGPATRSASENVTDTTSR